MDKQLYYKDVPLPRITYDGEIQVILGCMYSGKTSELQRRGRRMSIAQKTVLYIKLDKDMRYKRDRVVTHDGVMEDAMVCGFLTETVEEALKHDVICIDEGQFFPNLLEYCDLMANVGKKVIIAMLDATFNRSAFPEGNTLEIISIARNVDKLTAVCQKCGVDGASTSALERKEDAVRADSSGKLIGGNDVYAALCRRCYFTNLSK
jgi:thymidine kinase